MQAAAAAALVGPDGVPLTGDDTLPPTQDPGLYPPPPPYPYGTTDGQAVVTQQIGPDGQPIITDPVQISDPAAMDPQQVSVFGEHKSVMEKCTLSRTWSQLMEKWNILYFSVSKLITRN